jgi:hypothetical protein
MQTYVTKKNNDLGFIYKTKQTKYLREFDLSDSCPCVVNSRFDG